MWKVKLVCVGRIREKFYAQACEEYAKRLGRFCDFSLVEVPECTEGEAEKCREREQAGILRAVEGQAVLFDVRGKKLSSEDFSRLVSGWMDRGAPLSLMIGGSYGVGPLVRARADEVLSVSDMTFPHMLFRVMAEEQLYRAFMIAAGSSYHK